MIEVIRRVILAAGLLWAAWNFWYTPEQLIAARVVDFEREYQKDFGELKRKPLGISARTRAFLRRQTDPGSARKYREATLASRPIPLGPAIAPEFLEELALAERGAGPYADRLVHGYVFFSAAEAPLDSVAPALRRSLRDTGFLNAYGSTGAVDVEFYFHPEPHSSDAPAAILFPIRENAAIYAFGAVAIYGMLGWLRRRSIRHDPLPLAVLDLISAVCAAFFFGLPLWVYPSTQAALDDLTGGTAWSWIVATIALLALLDLARRAAFAIECEPDMLRIRHLFRARNIPWSQVTHAEACNPEGPRPGLELQLTSGERVFLPWTGMRDFLLLVRTLRRFGWLRPATNRAT